MENETNEMNKKQIAGRNNHKYTRNQIVCK